MMLNWNAQDARRHFFADVPDVGRFTVKRERYARKWSAIFMGRLVDERGGVHTERRQNFIASVEEAKAICLCWASGATNGTLLAEMNKARCA